MTSTSKNIHNALKQIHRTVACSTIQGFSISGLATYLQFPELDFCVDMGECPLSAIPLNHVFLTHAHGDHARCLMRHNSLRKMMGVERDSVYYLPEEISEGAKAWIKAEAMFEGVGEQKKWLRLESYGPKFVENIVQATSRDLLVSALRRLSHKGYRIVMHIHDEAVLEVPEGESSVEEVCAIMAETPAWAEGLILNADGYECNFYKKD